MSGEDLNPLYPGGNLKSGKGVFLQHLPIPESHPQESLVCLIEAGRGPLLKSEMSEFLNLEKVVFQKVMLDLDCLDPNLEAL